MSLLFATNHISYYFFILIWKLLLSSFQKLWLVISDYSINFVSIRRYHQDFLHNGRSQMTRISNKLKRPNYLGAFGLQERKVRRSSAKVPPPRRDGLWGRSPGVYIIHINIARPHPWLMNRDPPVHACFHNVVFIMFLNFRSGIQKIMFPLNLTENLKGMINQHQTMLCQFL